MTLRIRALPLVLSLLCLGARTATQHVFIQPQSAAPGETVQVYASTQHQYQVFVYRSFYFGDEVEVERSSPIQGQPQGRKSGSYAWVATNPALEITGPLSLEAWIRPATAGNGGFQGILTKSSVGQNVAYMMYLTDTGRLSFYLSRSGQFIPASRLVTAQIANRVWTHVVATWDGTTMRVYLNGELRASRPFAGPIFDTPEPLRVGAYASAGVAGQFFDGEIDSPAIYNRALTAPEIAQRHAERADYIPSNPGVLPGAVAQWNFGERDGLVLLDATGNGHDLTLVNYATRGVPGPSPRTAPQESHSVRFAGDDRLNPAWTSDYGFTIPPSWDSGFYIVEVRRPGGSQRVPLIVKPAPPARERIAVLAATNTWHAYNEWSKSLYTTSIPGDLAYYVGMRQPNPGGQADLHSPGIGISHLVDAERYLYKWLDDNGYPFDLYSDLDLHRDASLLDAYDVLMISGHSEYWSHRMVDHVEAFQNAGGSVVNLSGNTMWSLVTYDPTYSVMEGRKHPHSSGTVPADERWHSQDGEPLGGTLRCIGRPEHAVIGTGFGIGSGGARGWAIVLQPQHWIFAGTGVVQGQRFGESGLNGGAMMGYEIDVIDPQWTPANVEVVGVGQYPTPTTQLDISNCQTRVRSTTTQGGEVIYFDHPGGGGVFGIPSVTVGGTLVIDPVASGVLRNVLNRFLTLQPASCIFRNGSGINPTGFECSGQPILGSSWQSTVATTPDTVSTAVGLSGAPSVQSVLGGEVLIGLVPAPVFLPGLGTHVVPVPNESRFLGAALFSQGFRVDVVGGTPTLVMFNAQDLILGPSGS